jgi:pathogenesis-related protein 1
MKAATFTGGSKLPKTMSMLAGMLLFSVLAACQSKPEAAVPPVLANSAPPAESEVWTEDFSAELPAVPDETAPAVSRSGAVDPAAMLAEHNRWRAEVGSPPLKWSAKLAGIAQGWADHLKNDSCGMYHSGNGYGENIYQATAIMWSDGRRDFSPKTAKDVVDAWGSEIKYYDYATNSCSGVCGHYTQLVWKDTTEVGCAMSVCGDNGQIWVCSYSPPGNFVGQRPY